MKTYCKKLVWPVVGLGLGLLGAGALRAEETGKGVERVPGRGGYIEAAHLRTSGEQSEVSGYVRRSTVGEPAAGSHVDVVVLGGDMKVIEAVSVRFSPAKIPVAGRFGLPHARFRAKLANRPPADATIRVVFHGEPVAAGGCAGAMGANTDRARQEVQ